MANTQRLPVNVLIESGVIQVSKKAQDDIIASFNEWRENYDVPVQFNINWRGKDYRVPPEHIDIYYTYIFNEFRLEADFAIESGIQRFEVFRKEGSRQVMIGTCTECCLHWALDRWFINKHTKISSRLAALPQYERVSLRIGQCYIYDPCWKDVERQEKEVKRGDILEMKNDILKSIEQVEQRHTSELKEKVAEIGEMRLNRKVQQLERDLEQKRKECRELSKKNKAAFDSMTEWNNLWNDMEKRLRKDNKESTGQLLGTVDQMWQGQTAEILSSIENMGDHVIASLKSHGEALGTQTCSHPEGRDKSPLEQHADLKDICSSLSKGLGDSWRKLGRALKVSSLDDIEARYGRFGNEELVWRVLEKWAESGNPTKEDLLQAVKEIGQMTILGPPMTDHHRGILQKLYPYLHNEMMDVELLFPYLRGDKILTGSQIEIILQGHGRFGKIENLLKMLPDLGCRAFDGFVKALEQSSQVHISKKLREIESMDPSVYGGDQMLTDTLSRQLSEKTAVKGIAEDDANTYVQILNTGPVRGLLFDILRFVKQIDTRTGRLEERMDEKNTIVQQTSSEGES